MCLGVPMQLTEIREPARALAESDGLRLEVDVSLIEDPRPGDYVIVHAGFAIERLNTAEAEARLSLLEAIGRAAPEEPPTSPG
ncbi:MAG: HypC/HybG/HupF family hydrogenase formation chaperone [Kiritimatiellae bacterium]|nr:HypC/HybG/HupF family hydrogenase formation chaperone [Kiritimatiellia bacterium]